MHDIAVEELLRFPRHAPFLKENHSNIKFIMQAIEELLPPLVATDTSHIPPQNCEVPDVPGEAAPPRFESLRSLRVVDLPEPLWWL